MPRPPRLLPLALLALLAACAAKPPADDPEAVAEFKANNDPAEPLNRRMFAVNQSLDHMVVRPAAETYHDILPGAVRRGIRNFLGNLRSPVILVNDMLQGEPRRAGDTLGRFLVNTTIGLGGFIDVAGDRMQVAGHTEDFGQTFAVWGVGEGPYMFIPLLGPTNPRDLSGYAVGGAASPLGLIAAGPAMTAFGASRMVLTAVDTRDTLTEPLNILNQSLDPYASYRSAYRQRRQAEIENRLDRAASPAATGTGFGTGNGLPPGGP